MVATRSTGSINPQTIETMKDIPLNLPPLVPASIVIAGGLLCPVLRAAEPPKLRIEPVSLNIIKKSAEAGSRRGNRFPMMGSAPSKGIGVTAIATPAGDFDGKLVPGEVRLESFEDDSGADLRGRPRDGERRGLFDSTPEPISACPIGEDGAVKLEFHAGRTPTALARSLTIRGSLAFAPDGIDEEARHDEVELEEGKTIEVGPVRLRFTRMNRGFGAFGNGGGEKMWGVEVLPDDDVVNPKLVLFGDDPDMPILNTHNRNGGVYQTINGRTSIGFRCPRDRLKRLKVSFTPRSELVEVPFRFRVGLGSFATRRDPQ